MPRIAVLHLRLSQTTGRQPVALRGESMRPLSRIESLIAEIVERPAWLLSPRRLHPLELTAALTRALEEHAVRLADRVIAPDGYELRLNPADFAAFAELRPMLERELAEFIARTVAERDLACNRPPRVSIVESEEARPGRVLVSARFSQAEPESTVVGYRAPRAGARAAQADPRGRARRPAGRAAGAATGPWLELLGEHGEPLEAYPLRPGGTLIGRRIGCAITLSDTKVSREHARIDLNGDGATLRDLGSLNGTLVNGRPLAEPRRLQPGDVITIGHARLRFAAP